MFWLGHGQIQEMSVAFDPVPPLRYEIRSRDSLLQVQREKFFYIQLNDREKMIPPILLGHPVSNEENDVAFQWCLWGRVFLLEREEGASH